jgi:transposase-like protein
MDPKPVEQIPPGEFQPTHCPRPKCAKHHLKPSDSFSYSPAGSYTRKCDGRRVPRFLCHSCKHTFSQQTFACTYFLKRPELLGPVAAGLNAGSAHRQIARTLDCAPSTVTRLSARLGRHTLLLQAQALDQLTGIGEPIVFDHFETFAFSQWDPVGVATTVGDRSWFVYGLDPAPHRRGGHQTTFQHRNRARRGIAPPPRGQVARSCGRSLDLLTSKLPPRGKLQINSDDHPAYTSAIRRHPAARRIEHRIYPNPKRGPKGAPRTALAIERDRAMFAVDVLHMLWRHSSAHHRRETIAFARRANAILERGFLFIAWRNFVKGRSERKPDPSTPAMMLGLTDKPWDWLQVLSRRLFPSRTKMPRGWMRVYRRQWVTPALGHNAEHKLMLAF